MKSLLKHKVIIIIILSSAIVVGAIICAVIFWPKKPLTLQEQLNQFKASLETINDTRLDENNNPVARNITRSIVITEDDKIVVEYKQTLKIYVDADKKLTAYLSFEEKYPSLETAEFNIFDEYYLSDDIMYTQRINGEDSTMSSFDSDIETFFVVLFENIGNLKYDFSEENFLSISEDAKLINQEGSRSNLNVIINTEKYAQFFGNNTAISNITNVKFEMSMIDSKFNSLKLTYDENELSVVINIEGHQAEPIIVPEWIL